MPGEAGPVFRDRRSSGFKERATSDGTETPSQPRLWVSCFMQKVGLFSDLACEPSPERKLICHGKSCGVQKHAINVRSLIRNVMGGCAYAHYEGTSCLGRVQSTPFAQVQPNL